MGKNQPHDRWEQSTPGADMEDDELQGGAERLRETGQQASGTARSKTQQAQQTAQQKAQQAGQKTGMQDKRGNQPR